MKKVTLFSLVFILYSSFFVLRGFAQAPQAIPYQAVARDSSNNVIPNKTISLRFSIHDSIATGTVVYKETQSATTNALGLFVVNIGLGTVVSGSFAGINWGSNNKFTQVEMDINGGTNYVTMGTSQMLSVPYALYAGSSSVPNGTAAGNTLHWNGTKWLADDSLYNSGGKIGIGTSSPATSAVLDMTSTNHGFLMPRMTAAQRDAILSPIVGLQIFNTDDQCVDIYNGSKWMETCGLIETGTATTADYWPSKANFAGTGRAYAVGFSIGTKGYIGTGSLSLFTATNDFWEWDQASNTWSQKANFAGTARYNATGFSIGTKGYIGTGYDANGNTNDFWEWDQATNTWTQKANFGGTARNAAVGFSIGTKGYIGTGTNGSSDNIDFWEWDQATNKWFQKANFAGLARFSAVGFSIGTKGYIGTGARTANGGAGQKDFWEWDQTSNAWTQKANFGGTARAFAVGFSISAEGYIGTGGDGNYRNDFWQWDQASNTWTQKTDFGGRIRFAAVGFSIGTKGYIGTGFSGGYLNDFWEYDPAIANAPVYAAPPVFGSAVSVNDGLWTLSGSTVYKTDNGGNVGIGTATPVNKLDVTGALAVGADYSGTIAAPANGAIIEGKVGIGTSAPKDMVDIFSDGGYDGTEFDNQPFEISSGNTSSDYTLYMGADREDSVSYIQSVHVTCCTAPLILNARGGDIGIGTTLPHGEFELALDQGRKPSTSTWTITSDARLKNIEGAYTKGLKEILQLQPVTYHYKNVGERKFADEVLKNSNVGFSAQEVQKIFPEAVGVDPDGYLNFNMHSILVAYVNAIKEQQKEIEELKAEKNTTSAALEKMEKENAALKSDVQKIKAQLGMDVNAKK